MPLTRTPGKYQEPRAHALRARYLRTFAGDEIPVPVESIAEDLLGLRIEQSHDLGDLSGKLLPAERLIVLNASEAAHEGMPIRRHRYTIAHELGHWVCHVLGAPAGTVPAASYCRAADLSHDADRAFEREANVFAAELLMPEQAVRDAWSSTAQVDVVAAHFGVSPLAAHWRLHSFGLVDRPAASGQREEGQA
jgi:hypothetical protein